MKLMSSSLRHFRSASTACALVILCSLLFLSPFAALGADIQWPWVANDCDLDGQADDAKLESQTITVAPSAQVCVEPPSYQLNTLRIYVGVYIEGQYFPETSSGDPRCKTVTGKTVNIYSSTICTVQPNRVNGTITYIAATPSVCACTSCDDCMVKLGDANCDIVELTANITDHAGTCIDNPAGFYGKVFDCKGHTIDGDQTGLDFGVYLGGGAIKNLNTIKNCTITGFDTGIYLGYGGDSNTITGNSISSNGRGIEIFNGQYNSVANNRIAENSNMGIVFGGTAYHNSVVANDIVDNSSYGVFFSDFAKYNTVSSNNNCSIRGWDIYDQGYLPYSSPPLRPNTGNGNTCHDDRAFWRDDSVPSGSSGCAYKCLAPTVGCVGATKTFYCGDTVTESCVLNGSMAACGSSIWRCLQVGGPDITIDCNGYSITGYDLPGTNVPDYGIYTDYSTNGARTTIKNCTINGFDGFGVLLYSSPWSTLINNTVRANAGGIYLSSSNQSALTNNRANSNKGLGILLRYSPNSTLESNTADSNTDGRGNGVGIQVSDSNYVSLLKNQVNSNDSGIILSASSYSTLSDNSVNSSTRYGLRLQISNSNTITGNIVSGTSTMWYGIDFLNSDSNRIYDNLFGSWSNLNIDSYSTGNSWNTARTAGANIVGGGYLGGNFWTNPSGTGFSDTCQDTDYDGICDSSYTLAANNIDYLPLTRPVPPNTPEGSDILISDTNTGVQITFSEVTGQGMTAVTASETGPAAPTGFLLASVYFDIKTTAVFSGNIEVCLPYDVSKVTSEENLKIMHWNGMAWEVVEPSPGGNSGLVCGSISSFSVFAVMESIHELDAVVDVDPNKLNLASKGNWVTVYIKIPGAHDLSQIVVSSIRLNGSIPAEESPTAIADHDNDGVMDLMVKFSRSSVQQVVSPGENTVTVRGEFSDQTVFSGKAKIFVIK